MTRNRSKLSVYRLLVLFIDELFILLSFYATYYFKNLIFKQQVDISEKYQLVLVITMACMPLLLKEMNGYDFYKLSRIKQNINVFKATILTLILVTFFMYVLKQQGLSRTFLMTFFSLVYVMLFISRMIVHKMINWIYSKQDNRTKIAVIGSYELAKDYIDTISRNTSFISEIAGYIELGRQDEFECEHLNCLGDIENLDDILYNNVIDEIVFAVSWSTDVDMEKYLAICEEFGVTVRMVTQFFNLKNAKSDITKVGDVSLVTFHTVCLDNYQLAAKRVIDVFGGLVGTVFFALIYLIVAPVIKFESKGPVIFSQKRVGKNGRIFQCYKFRTMCDDAEKQKQNLMKYNEMEGAMFKIKDDPRITKVGNFLRKTSLDEFPQFINVLKGDMSLVGTRPPTIDEVDKYDMHHWRRLSIKPGITGMWQANGRSDINDFEEIVKLDLDYIDNWSILLDVKLLAKTVANVVKKDGSY